MDQPANYVIESDVPIPKARAPMTRGVCAVLSKLAVGQSVVFPQYRVVKNMGGIGTYLFRRIGFKYSARKTSDGVRVWRIS